MSVADGNRNYLRCCDSHESCDGLTESGHGGGRAMSSERSVGQQGDPGLTTEGRQERTGRFVDPPGRVAASNGRYG